MSQITLRASIADLDAIYAEFNKTSPKTKKILVTRELLAAVLLDYGKLVDAAKAAGAVR